MSKATGVIARALLAVGLAASAALASAQAAFPNKSIRFLVPYPPGSGTAVARIVGDKLAERWGQPVIIDSRPGGDTIIGADIVAKSPPDGHTFMLISGSHVTLPLLHAKVPFDAMADFAPIATLTSSELVLAASPSFPLASLKELIDAAKAQPGKYSYAHSGKGGPSHIVAETFNLQTGARLRAVPYRGSGPAVTDLLGGHVDLFFGPPSVLTQHILAGKLKGLAITGDGRLPTLPAVPTFAQAGLPELGATKNWYAVLAPRGTPRDIVDRISRQIGEILGEKDVRTNLESLGFTPYISTPAQTESLMHAESEKVRSVMKAAGIRPE